MEIKKIRIRSLVLIHISDLERLEESLHENPKEIWNYLKYNQRDKKFIPPFYQTVNKKWLLRKYPKRIVELFTQLISKYNPDGE